MTKASNKKILLAVSGMSPQIITETLYSLITEHQWIPDEIRLISTLQGRQNAILQLLEGESYFHQLLRDYHIDHPIHFTPDSIQVIRNAQGHALADLRTPDDNQAAADLICQVIRELTSEASVELHVSLAGGRKTMGFYAGYALSLFGRPQDRLSHVLVSKDFESNRNFFYPTPNTRVIHSANGSPLDANKAEVWLAEIPFVRLRNKLPDSLFHGHHSFSETVKLAREATEQIHLVLVPKDNRVQVNGRNGTLTPVLFAILLLFVERARQGKPPLEPILDIETRSADELISVSDHYWVSLSPSTLNHLERDGLTQKWLEQNASKLNKRFAQLFGEDLAERCKLSSRFHNGHRGYSLPGDLNIEIIE